jgi:hypothetical protein
MNIVRSVFGSLFLHLFVALPTGKMKAFGCLVSVLSLLGSAVAIGQNATIAFQSSSGGLKLASRDASVQIMVDNAEWPAVLRAADDMAKDFGRVTGTNGSVTLTKNSTSSALNATMIFNVTNESGFSISGKGGKGGVIIAGTIGRSTLIDGLVKSGKVKVSDIQGKWESFTSTLVGSPMAGVSQALVIAGKYSTYFLPLPNPRRSRGLYSHIREAHPNNK